MGITPGVGGDDLSTKVIVPTADLSFAQPVKPVGASRATWRDLYRLADGPGFPQNTPIKKPILSEELST